MTSARRLATDVVGHCAGIGAGQPGTLGHATNHSAIRVLWSMNDYAVIGSSLFGMGSNDLSLEA